MDLTMVRNVRGSYGLKLVVSFLAVLLVIGAIGGIIYTQTTHQLNRDAEQQLETRARDHAAALDTWMNNSRSTARILSNSVAAETSEGTLGTYLQTLAENGDLTAGARAVHYVNASTSEIMASSLDGRVGANPRDEGAPWAQSDLTSLDSDEVIVSAFNPTAANTTVITFTTPVTGVDDRALVYVTDVRGVAGTLRQSSDSAYTRVIDENGVVVVSQHDAGEVGTKYDAAGGNEDVGAISKALNGSAGYDQLRADQTPAGESERVVGYAPMSTTDWAVVVHDKPSTVFSLRNGISMGLIALLAATVLGLGAIGLTIGRSTLASINALAAKARRMDDGDLDLSLETDRTDEIGDLFRAFDSMRDSLKSRITEAETARERAESQQAEAERARERAETAKEEIDALVSHLETKADDYGSVMARTAAGDLTGRMDPSAESDAMARIAREFNEMADELEATISDVQSFADTVAASSEEVTASTEEIRSASEEVSESVQEIADGSARQTESLDEVATEMTDLSATVEEISSSTDEVAETSRRATERGEAGREHASDALDQMSHIEDQTADTVEAVTTLDEEMEAIGEIVEVIDDIAEQTNTLALNASIEAARAGEAGEGFAVVADEVKQLATETREATTEVESRIETLSNRATESVEEIEAMQERVSTGLETVDDALSELDAIVDDIGDVNAGVQSIDDATDEQAESAQEVVTMVDDVSDISDETASETENVSAAAEEQASSLTQISASTQQLSDQAERLASHVDEFTVEQSSSVDSDATGHRSAVDD